MFNIGILMLFAVNFFHPVYISIYSHLTNSQFIILKQDKPNAFYTDLDTVVAHQLQLEVIVAS